MTCGYFGVYYLSWNKKERETYVSLPPHGAALVVEMWLHVISADTFGTCVCIVISYFSCVLHTVCVSQMSMSLFSLINTRFMFWWICMGIYRSTCYSFMIIVKSSVEM